MDDTVAISDSTRRWSWALVVLWTFLAVWGFVIGNLWLPLFQLALAGAILAALLSPRVAAFLYTPLRRRK